MVFDRLMKIVAFVFATLMSVVAPFDNFTGTWTRGELEKGGGRLLTKHEGGRLRFELECWRGAPSYNSGFLEGTLTLSNGEGTFQQSSGTGRCELRFVFSDDNVAVRYLNESVDCGFGHGVFANGVYNRTSRDEPTFSERDPRVRP